MKKIKLEDFSIYSKYINYTLYPLIIIFIALAAFYGYRTYINKKAEQEFNSALTLLMKNINKSPKNKELKKALNMFEHIVNNYSLSKYSNLSMPFLGYLYFLEGNYDKSIKFYSKFKNKIHTYSSMEYIALSNLAISSCYEQKKDLNKAIKILNKFCEEHPESPFREFALLSLERLYRLNNNYDKEKKTIKEFIRDYPNSPFFYMVKSHLLSYNNKK